MRSLRGDGQEDADVNSRGTGAESRRPALLCIVKGKDAHDLSHYEEWYAPRMKGNQRRMVFNRK